MDIVMIKKLLYVLTLLVCTAFYVPNKKHIKVYLIGDSTVCLYEPNRAPLTGWGMPFAIFFDSTVTIDNRAKGGRSTRTFIAENRWQPIWDNLQPGDYVFMQFGHNDEAKEEKYKDRYTTPEDYKKNLTRFIIESRNKQAIPVLITPVSRMQFDSAGHAKETHATYSALVFEVAKQTATPVIDLDKKSRELIHELGPKYAKLLFMQLEPGEHPNYPEGQKDNTHFTEFGARRMAEIVLVELNNQNIELAERIVKPTAKS